MKLLVNALLFFAGAVAAMLFLGNQRFGLRHNAIESGCLSTGADATSCSCLRTEVQAEIGLLKGAVIGSGPLRRVLGLDKYSDLEASVPIAVARCSASQS